jgi:hypothetical protein
LDLEGLAPLVYTDHRQSQSFAIAFFVMLGALSSARACG